TPAIPQDRICTFRWWIETRSWILKECPTLSIRLKRSFPDQFAMFAPRTKNMRRGKTNFPWGENSSDFDIQLENSAGMMSERGSDSLKLPSNRETVDWSRRRPCMNSLLRDTDLNEAAGAADANAWAEPRGISSGL